MRARMLPPIVLVALATLAGCTATPAPEPSPTSSAEPRTAPLSTGSDLLGSWTISDLSDGGTATITFTGASWTAQYECGEVGGAWAAANDVILATYSGGSMGCFDSIDPQPTLAWVDNAVSLRASTGGWDLLDGSGSLVATLSGRSDEPTDQETRSPNVDQGARYTSTPAPLPAEFSVGDLTGRWIPEVDKPGESFLEFRESEWASSDGCNGAGGKWADLSDGYLLTTPISTMTMMGCGNIPVAQWVGSARTAGFDGDTLVLFDVDGAELGRLLRG